MPRKKPPKPEPVLEYADLANQAPRAVSQDLRPVDMPTRSGEPKPEPVPEEKPEPVKEKPPKQIKVAEKLIMEFPAPQSLLKERNTRAQDLARAELTTLQVDLSEIIALRPDTVVYEYPVSELPDDVISIIVESMRRAGWKLDYDHPRRNIIIELPVVKLLTPPLSPPVRSVATPL